MEADLKKALQEVLDGICNTTDHVLQKWAGGIKNAVIGSFDCERALLFAGRLVYKIGERASLWNNNGLYMETAARVYKKHLSLNDILRQSMPAYNSSMGMRKTPGEWREVDNILEKELRWDIFLSAGDKSRQAGEGLNATDELRQETARPKQEPAINPREAKYFDRAIKAGVMEKNGEGYKWLHNDGRKASLAYFLQKVFDPDGKTQLPYMRMEKLFGVTRLDTAVYQLANAKRLQKWRANIDNLFID